MFGSSGVSASFGGFAPGVESNVDTVKTFAAFTPDKNSGTNTSNFAFNIGNTSLGSGSDNNDEATKQYKFIIAKFYFLCKSFEDKIAILKSKSLLEVIHANELYEATDKTFGSVKILFDEISTVCSAVTQEQFDNNRVNMSKMFDEIKGFRTKLSNQVDIMMSVFTDQNTFLTQCAQKSVTEHKFEEVDEFRKAIDLVEVTKANVVTLIVAFVETLDTFYSSLEERMKTFLEFNLKSFPSATEMSKLSCEHWRNQLVKMDEESGVTAHLHSALNLLKCLIYNAATHGSKYIVIAPEVIAPATTFIDTMTVLFDYHDEKNALRLDALWLQEVERWPPISEDQIHYLHYIKSIGVKSSDIYAFNILWNTALGRFRIRNALIRYGYQVGTLLLDEFSVKMGDSNEAGNRNETRHIKARPINNPSVNYPFGNSTGVSSTGVRCNDGAVVPFTSTPILNFNHTMPLVINLWSHEGAPMKPTSDSAIRNLLFPFSKTKEYKTVLPNYRRTLSTSNQFKPLHLQSGKNFNGIENIDIVFIKAVFSVGNIDWIDPEVEA